MFLSLLCVALAQNCKCGTLRDTSLAERMQLDKDLTLDTAVSTARQSETIERQQTDVRGVGRTDTDAEPKGRTETSQPKNPRGPKHPSAKPQPSSDRRTCYTCATSPGHVPGQRRGAATAECVDLHRQCML